MPKHGYVLAVVLHPVKDNAETALTWQVLMGVKRGEDIGPAAARPL